MPNAFISAGNGRMSADPNVRSAAIISSGAPSSSAAPASARYSRFLEKAQAAMLAKIPNTNSKIRTVK